MILDEIIEAVKVFRLNDEACPFQHAERWENCNNCKLLFPEIIGTEVIASDEEIKPCCPCNMTILGDDFVKEEMRRLFP